MAVVTDVYLEFSTPEKVAEASARIAEKHENQNSNYEEVLRWGGNRNPRVLEIDFAPVMGPLATIASELGAIRATHNHEELWKAS